MVAWSFSGHRAGYSVRRGLFAICLAAAAIAGDERPAGGGQLCKAGASSAERKLDPTGADLGTGDADRVERCHDAAQRHGAVCCPPSLGRPQLSLLPAC